MAAPSNEWGFNFRNTNSGGFAGIDPANSTYVLPTDSAASRSIGADTVSFGWASSCSARDRSATAASGRLAGFHWSEAGATGNNTFTVTLFEAGVYDVRLAFGDETDGPHDMSAVEIRDNGTTKYTFAEQSAANFIDANGSTRADAAAWASGNVARQITFNSTTFQLYCPYTTSKDFYLSHLNLAYVGPASPERNPSTGAIVCAGRAPSVSVSTGVWAGWRRELYRSWYASNRPTLPAAVRTFYVDAASGDDSYSTAQAQNSATPWQTLAKCATNATAGDLFYLKGTFSDQSFIAASSGTVSNWIAFKPWPGQSATIHGRNDSYPAFFLTSRSYYWIEGLTLDLSGGSGLASAVSGFSSTPPTGLVVKDCVCVATADATIDIRSRDDCWIEGCMINNATGAGYTGVYWGTYHDGATGYAPDNQVVFNCTFGDHGHTAIEGYTGTADVGGSGGYATNVRIGFNTFNNRQTAAIGGGKVDGYIVEGNDIFNSAVDNLAAGSWESLYVMGINGIYRYNRMAGGRRDAIFFQPDDFDGGVNCANNDVYGNVVYNHGGSAVKFIVNDATGLDIDVAGNRLRNNIFWNNLTDVQWSVAGYEAILVFVPNTTSTFTQAFFWSTGSRDQAQYLKLDGALNITNNLIGTDHGVGSASNVLTFWGSTDTSPKDYTNAQAEAQFGVAFASNVSFTNPIFASTDSSLASVEANDAADIYLAISTASPAIDMGNAVGSEGYTGTAIDAGAYEYDPAAPPSSGAPSRRRRGVLFFARASRRRRRR